MGHDCVIMEHLCRLMKHADVLCYRAGLSVIYKISLKVLVTTIDSQWEGIGDVGLARYEPALRPPCPTIRVLSYSS